ncbi:MAG: hypothetical protein ACRDZR_01075 [Acidimicrobiales bacterium]
MVQTLLHGAKPWTGKAADAFASRYEGIRYTKQNIDEQIEDLSNIVRQLQGNLDRSNTLLAEANSAAAVHGLSINNNGTISHSWLSDIDILKDYDRWQIERKAQAAGESFAQAINEAIIKIKNSVHPVTDLACTASLTGGSTIAVDPESLCVVAVKGIAPLASTTDSSANSLRSIPVGPFACVEMGFGAKTIDVVLDDARQTLTSNLRVLQKGYTQLRACVEEAAAAYLGADQLRGWEALEQGLETGSVVVTGTLGIAGGQDAQAAMVWAKRQTKVPDTRYKKTRGLCYTFVSHAYHTQLHPVGLEGWATTAYSYYKGKGQIWTTQPPPAGAVVFYKYFYDGRTEGHAALSIGNGEVICTSNVGSDPIVEVGYTSFPPSMEYEGWYLPAG